MHATNYGKHLANLHSLRLVKERVILGRLEGLLTRAPDASSERALASIMQEATSQRGEIEDVLLQWRRSIGTGPRRDVPLRKSADLSFREVLQGLVRVQREGAKLYAAAARDCPDPELAKRLSRLATQDEEHALVLEELLDRA